MKKSFLVPLLAAGALVSVAQADNTASAQLKIESFFETALELAANQELKFADHTLPGTGEPSNNQTVTCNSDGVATATFSAGANFYAAGSSSASKISSASNNFSNPAYNVWSGQCGKLTVTGYQNAYYSTSVVNPTSSATTPTISVNCASGNKLDADGNATIWCGGRLSVSSSVKTGYKTATASVTVTYD